MGSLVKPIRDLTPDELYAKYGNWIRYLAYNHIKLYNLSIEWGDLINSGVIGILTAQKKYDPEKGSFTTYSRHWIIREFQSLMKEQIGHKRIDWNFNVENILTESIAENFAIFNQSVDKTMSILSDKQKSIFTKYFIEGLSTTDIANINHTSRQAVHKMVSKLMEKLKETIHCQ